jgi:hypothetical protein
MTRFRHGTGTDMCTFLGQAVRKGAVRPLRGAWTARRRARAEARL